MGCIAETTNRFKFTYEVRNVLRENLFVLYQALLAFVEGRMMVHCVNEDVDRQHTDLGGRLSIMPGMPIDATAFANGFMRVTLPLDDNTSWRHLPTHTPSELPGSWLSVPFIKPVIPRLFSHRLLGYDVVYLSILSIEFYK